VTIPGWQIEQGLPTVVRYGTPGFVSARNRGPKHSGRQLFVGGAGGTAVLSQVIRLQSPKGGTLPAGRRCVLSAWLGAGAKSYARIEARFLSPSGATLATLELARVRQRDDPPGGGLVLRSGTEALPEGTAKVQVLVILGTYLTDFDGPHAPKVGYDRGEADNASFSVAARVRAPPPLRAPPAHVPHFRHVFLVMMENQGYNRIIGNRAEAPFLNSLLPQSSLLGDFFAEEHPSDGNYLALAAGSTFGIPLTDPLEENPTDTIDAPNIGDLVTAADESWKAYLQSADGPCDDTVHGYYWDDDLPFLYFRDIRYRPAYCAAHVVPLYELASDLRTTATTPSFSWIGPNDCTDMEGCGIRAGDDFLRSLVQEVESSPAWTTQRSLFIITFDEDAYNHERPAQRVATIVFGSGVKQGYVSPVRYTHYSLLRTVEAALGLSTLTANDRFATPLNDVFSGGGGLAVSSALQDVAAAMSTTPARPVPARRAPAAPPPPSAIALSVNSASDSVTPIVLATGHPRAPIAVGRDPTAIAVAFDGIAYVVNSGSGSVTPINTTTLEPSKAIRVGDDPSAIVITPNGRTAFVANAGSDSVTPIDTVTGRARRPIRVGDRPVAMAMTPDGRTLYVVDEAGDSVTPIDVSTEEALAAITVGVAPTAVAVSPSGTMAYVVDYGSGTVTPILTADNRVLRPIRVGRAPNAIAVVPDGAVAYVVDGDSDAVTPIDTDTDQALAAIPVGFSPTAVAVSPLGNVALVVNTISGTVTPIDTAIEEACTPISVGRYSYPTAVFFTSGGGAAEVLDTYGGGVTAISVPALVVVSHTRVGGYPVALGLSPDAVAEGAGVAR
jgi:YVTN family beta-propeller protein